MTDSKIFKLIVRTKDWYCNIPVTRIEKVGEVVCAYLGDDFVGMFKLDAVDALHLSEAREA